jgi:hypothetical protein
MRSTFSLRRYLKDRRGFIKVATASFAVPFAVAVLWMFGAHGGLGWWLFLVVLALGAGWLWASAMWLVVKSDLERIPSDSQPPTVREDNQ